VTLTYQEAADRTGKNIRTIFRWAAKGYVRRVPTPDGWKVSMSDVDVMIGKKWTRKPRVSGA